MGSKARRMAISMAGLALVGGTTMGLAAPASAATPTPTGNDVASAAQRSKTLSDRETQTAVSGRYTKVETTELEWGATDRQRDYAAEETTAKRSKGNPDCDDDECADDSSRRKDQDDDRDSDVDKDRRYGKNRDNDGSHRSKNRKRERVEGFHRSYRACKAAGAKGKRKGWWDSYDCDFTKRGYKGWHQSWNKWGGNDWRCRGRWALNVRG